MKEIILISSIAGILGTGLGGVIGILLGSKSIGKNLAFTGGIMSGIVFFDLIPISIKNGNLFVAIISVLIGMIFISLIDSLVVSYTKKNNIKFDQKLIKTGIVMLITMSLHNFPEGMAIGSSRAESINSCLLIAFVIAVHDIPEGMSISTPLIGGHMKKGKIFILTIISGFSTILGAIIGLWFGEMSNMGLSVCLGLAAGAMLYVVFGELIPDALESTTKKSMAIVSIIGIIISLILLNLFH